MDATFAAVLNGLYVPPYTLRERRILTSGLVLAGAMARDMKAQAPGPAGADRKPVADLLFILSADMVGAGHASLCLC